MASATLRVRPGPGVLPTRAIRARVAAHAADRPGALGPTSTVSTGNLHLRSTPNMLKLTSGLTADPVSARRWSELDRSARAFRIGHAAIALVELSCLGYVWRCAITRHRDRLLAASMIVLTAQGLGLVIGRGNCPLGPLQGRLGDPVPLFELVLPPRAAKAAIPTLAALTLIGVLALVWRRPRRQPAAAF
jgi:hypothetical protein